MPLPKQVADAEARSDKAIEDFRTANAPAQDPPAAPPVDTPPAADPPATPPKVDEPKREDYKAKYLTLQGMYNADVPRLNRELKDTRAERDALVAEVATLKAAKPTEPAPANADLPQAVVDALGADAAAAIRKMVAEQATSVRDEVDKQLQPMKEKADATADAVAQNATAREQQARGSFLAALTDRMPDWQTIDAREDWHDFLAEKDRFARRPRQELLTEAASAGDIDAVAAFFEAFKESAGLNTPAAPPPSAQDRLALQQVPDQSGRSAVNTDKKVWTKAEIADFYKRVALNKVPLKDIPAIEADIVAAGSEGRIR